MPSWWWWGRKAGHDRMSRVLCCFNEWLRRIAPARGSGGRACHGMKSLPRYLQMAGRWFGMGDALWPARVVVRWWLDGLPFKAKSCVLASPLSLLPSRARLLATGSFRVARFPTGSLPEVFMPRSRASRPRFALARPTKFAKAHARTLESEFERPATTLDQRPTATTLPTNILAH